MSEVKLQLSVAEIAKINSVLNYESERTPKGELVPKTYSVKDLSAVNWFEKNTKDVLDKWDKFRKPKVEELQKKVEEEIKKEKLDEKLDSDKLAQVKEMALQAKATEDKEFDAEMKKEHEIKLSENTLEVIKREYKDAKFAKGDDVAVSLIEKLGLE